MPALRVAKIAAYTNAALAVLAVYYVTRVWNYTPLAAMPSSDAIAFSVTGVPPLLALWIGSRLARGSRSAGLLALGLSVALAAYAMAFLIVFRAGEESMAPLLIVLTSLWTALGLAALLVAVWLRGRREAAPGQTDASP